MGFQKEKDKYLDMALKEKRNHYQCRYPVSLDEVPTWQFLASDELLLPPDDEEVEFDFDRQLNKKVSIWEGDITTLEIDIVVNAANSTLSRGARGVNRAIFSAASSLLEEECVSLRPCKPGSVKISGGYKLPAKYILHAVGPTDRDPDVLASCYKNCLQYLKTKKEPMPDLRSIAFPCLSTGMHGFPYVDAAKIALLTTRNFLEDNRDSVDRVIFCLFTNKDKKLYRKLMQVYFPLQ